LIDGTSVWSKPPRHEHAKPTATTGCLTAAEYFIERSLKCQESSSRCRRRGAASPEGIDRGLWPRRMKNLGLKLGCYRSGEAVMSAARRKDACCWWILSQKRHSQCLFSSRSDRRKLHRCQIEHSRPDSSLQVFISASPFSQLPNSRPCSLFPNRRHHCRPATGREEDVCDITEHFDADLGVCLFALQVRF